MSEKKLTGPISAQAVVVTQSLTVHGNFNAASSTDARESSPLKITRILLESSRWKTETQPRSGWKALYPFDKPCEQYCYLESHLGHQDPVLDVLVSNNRDRPVILLSVGLFVSETADVTYMYGGHSPRTYRVTRDDLFEIKMPKMKSLWPQMPKSYPPGKEDVEIDKRDLLIPFTFNDPIGIEAHQPYRFGLLLKEYVSNMPNNVLCRINLETDVGPVSSGLLYLFTY
jgi:hypothetical protein